MQAEGDIEGGRLDDNQGRNRISNGEDHNTIPVAKEEKDSTLVDWNGPDDPENPQNWSALRKWMITTNMGLVAFCATFSSSIFSTATAATASESNVSQEVMILGTSVFVLGFSFGPIFWGPLSEIFGRRIPLFTGIIGFVVFQIPVAVASNVQTIVICRFIGGCFGAAPLAVVGGGLADIWNPVDRTMAICIFAGGTFIGPVGAPIVGGFIVDSHLGWRRTLWITLIMSVFFSIIGFFTIPETSPSAILQHRAKNLRYQTKNWALHAKADEHRVDPWSIVTVYLARPLTMLYQEPILLLMTLYMSFIYGILYLFFEAFPIIFQENRGWNEGVSGLPFLSIIIGVIMGSVIMVYSTKTRFVRKYRENGNKFVPEERLPPMVLGAIVLPIGLFWFAWTDNPHILWVPQVIAAAPVGMGIFIGFWQGLNYLIDCYGPSSNSAIAGNTFLRSLAGAGFPLFATPMYHNLGVPWATSLLAFLCIVFVPAPIVFYYYGARIRSWSTMTAK
ncbi:major facilitator superfamily domain-containing protein [Talaromyces proteolyticus]|uniref:Major facilitator superfamily domain-containing protein n=1 Tax=Talaromyces proteolyticus TaxID=1131652 RepID=A0AAD4KEH6_9EURO|nr:major facilitator superfamily domain-containing protein [Talaromyces proteolyticus]KAH8690332.1 major facilitator superfamily domain-containing protein [Talaromyces proteolyticus]